MRMEDTGDTIVHLNVGGTHYEVSRETLERCEGSILASLRSDNWKEGDSDDSEAILIEGNGQFEYDRKPIFIDRNGRLFEYVLDYLRTNELHLPSSVSPAAVKKEFEYYGLDANVIRENVEYDNTYFLEKAKEVTAERNQIAAMNAAKQSAEFMKETEVLNRELVFFIMIEYYKINPSPRTSLAIVIPKKYQSNCSSSWVREDLKTRGFEILNNPLQCIAASSLTIASVPKSDEKV